MHNPHNNKLMEHYLGDLGQKDNQPWTFEGTLHEPPFNTITYNDCYILIWSYQYALYYEQNIVSISFSSSSCLVSVDACLIGVREPNSTSEVPPVGSEPTHSNLENQCMDLALLKAFNLASAVIGTLLNFMPEGNVKSNKD